MGDRIKQFSEFLYNERGEVTGARSDELEIIIKKFEELGLNEDPPRVEYAIDLENDFPTQVFHSLSQEEFELLQEILIKKGDLTPDSIQRANPGYELLIRKTVVIITEWPHIPKSFISIYPTRYFKTLPELEKYLKSQGKDKLQKTFINGNGSKR